MSLVRACLTWCRDTFRWSNSKQSWEERLSGLALLVGVFVLAWWGQALELIQQVVLWGLLILAGALLLRRGWLKLFGPVLFYDMVRQARRNRYFLLRMAYAGLLIFFLFITWLEFNERYGEPRKLYPLMNQTYFFEFMIIQFIAIGLLTPAYVGGAIADEKERKTLEFMLATDLRNREIVLSKLVARLANLTMFILTGLPILSCLQFLGGIDPNLLLAGYAATFLTMFGMGGFAIFASVHFKKPRDAIVFSYLGPIVYLVSGWLGLALKFSTWAFVKYPVGWGSYSFTLADVIDWYNMGNLPICLGNITRAFDRGQLAQVLVTNLREYAFFHILLGAGCTTWAVLRLRVLALQQSHGTTQKARIRHRARPGVWDSSLLWKEIWVEDRSRFSWVATILISSLFVLTIGLGAWMMIYEALRGQLDPRNVAEFTTMAGTAVACLIILGVAVRASTCISSERDKDTFDFLLTTPLDSDTILWAKFLGCLLSLRRSLIWIGIIWLMGILGGGISIIEPWFLMVTILIYASAFIMLGMWFSITAKSSMRATVWTIMSTVGISVGHWLLTACCGVVFFRSGGGGRSFEDFFRLQLGMTPPFVIGFFHYIGFEIRRNRGFHFHEEEFKLFFCSLLGLFVYAMGCLFFWKTVLSPRFRKLTHREHRMYPDGLETNTMYRSPNPAKQGPLESSLWSPVSPPDPGQEKTKENNASE